MAIKKGHQPPESQGPPGDGDPLLSRGSTGSRRTGAARPTHKAAPADTALNHTLPAGIIKSIYLNIYCY